MHTATAEATQLKHLIPGAGLPAPDLASLKQATVAAQSRFDAFYNRFSHDNPATEADAEKYFIVAGQVSDALAALAKALIELPDDGFSVNGSTKDGRMVLLNASAQKPGLWQLTRFCRDGLPWGDTQYETKKQAVGIFLEDIEIETLSDLHGTFSVQQK